MRRAFKTTVKSLLPASVLRMVQQTRWQARRVGHRLRYVASGRRTAGIGIGSFGGNRIAYRIHSVDTEVLGHSFEHDIFFAEVPDLRLEPDAIILDVGAHIGTFTVLAAAKVPRGRVFAVEASRDTFELLSLNVELSGRTNITAEHLALSDTTGTVTLHHDPEGNYGHSITRALSGSSETVTAATLTGYLAQRDVAAVALAKFNCEGAEFPILLSTPCATLRRLHTLIVLYHSDLANLPVSALTQHFEACGFQTRLTNTTADRGWIIATRRSDHDEVISIE
jgi:FkbM family methyltransferase